MERNCFFYIRCTVSVPGLLLVLHLSEWSWAALPVTAQGTRVALFVENKKILSSNLTQPTLNCTQTSHYMDGVPSARTWNAPWPFSPGGTVLLGEVNIGAFCGPCHYLVWWLYENGIYMKICSILQQSDNGCLKMALWAVAPITLERCPRCSWFYVNKVCPSYNKRVCNFYTLLQMPTIPKTSAYCQWRWIPSWSCAALTGVQYVTIHLCTCIHSTVLGGCSHSLTTSWDLHGLFRYTLSCLFS